MNDQQESLAAGWNIGLGSLVNIATIKPTGDEYFGPPESTPHYDDGVIKIDGDGNVQIQGYATISWMFTRLTYLQLAYARTTWCNGGLSGLVTILTPIASNNGTYTRLNAVLILPKPAELRPEYRYKDAMFRFTRLKTPT